jgi:hypothetical protein
MEIVIEKCLSPSRCRLGMFCELLFLGTLDARLRGSKPLLSGNLLRLNLSACGLSATSAARFSRCLLITQMPRQQLCDRQSRGTAARRQKPNLSRMRRIVTIEGGTCDNRRGGSTMASHRNQGVRKPATKFPNLQKKMAKNKLQAAKQPRKPQHGER